MANLTNSPPSVDYAPLELQADLIAMQQLSIDELLAIAQSQITNTQYQLHLELLEKNQNNQLNQCDRLLLQSLRVNADHLMLKKTYAWAVLKWKEYPIPEFDQLLEG